MWTSEITVDFVPLPKEKEDAYWETMRYFAEVLRKVVEDDLRTALLENIERASISEVDE